MLKIMTPLSLHGNSEPKDRNSEMVRIKYSLLNPPRGKYRDPAGVSRGTINVQTRQNQQIDGESLIFHVRLSA